MSNVVPKEQQSAYQRWEMASFDDARVTPQAANLSAVSLPTVDEILTIREQARIEGYAAGVAEGRTAGLAAGRSEATEERARLLTIAASFATEVAQADELIANEVLDLALDLAKAMLKTALDVRPELINAIVSEAIHYLPALHQPARLYLNPNDLLLVKNQMGDELDKTGWHLAEDAQLEPGGCRVETAHNQIDASLSTRWQRIAAALGKESDWLAS
ncbi:flagellar assembly protein FliH [Sulfuriferula plumbiphila]|uniref:Flagellar assembly protein FliH n=1 Tax=Sulfuriferula plumbiphila TaxID=171865 RepID=A0A512L4B2_9PROT|nr:flagellar assembly protein FliH [Sulfuriferula plumbiphila]BBP03856.1 flagellar assembly protein FliH [Sulfuriferula plumbiphila]GEP29315.1 flagellar assembly protein FliH [Sulfuriferula plumbiphila]